MEFINTTGKEFKITYGGSLFTIPPGGIVLSDLNRELLNVAIKDPRLEVVKKDKAVANIILASFGNSIGLPSGENPLAETVKKDGITFHNDTYKALSIIGCGSRFTVEAGQDITLSGNNDELIAAAILVPGLYRVGKKPPESAVRLAEEKKKEAVKNKVIAAKTPPVFMKKEVISQEEAVQQSTSLHTSVKSNNNRPNIGDEKVIGSELETELAKGILPNEPGTAPAGGLRVV